MSEVYEHNPGDHEDPVTGATWMIGFLGVVLLVVIVLGLTALYYNADHEEYEKKIVDTEPVELQALRAQQNARLIEGPVYREVREGEPEQLVTALVIPLDQAIARALDEQKQARAAK